MKLSAEPIVDDKRWGVLFNATPIPTVLLKADKPVYTIVFANEAYLKFNSLVSDEIIGGSFITLMQAHKRVTGDTQQSLQQLLCDKLPQKQSSVKMEFLTPEGGCTKYVDIYNTPVFDDDGEVEFIIRTVNDVTELKTAEKALTESNKQYQALIESVEGVVWEADANTFEFTYISNKIRDILGYTPEEWLNDPQFWVKHIYHDDRNWAVTFCQHKTRDMLSHVFDYRMVRADGGIVWIKDLVSVIAENGKPKLLRGVMIDVSVSKLLSNLDHLEKSVLELVTDMGGGLYHILNFYLKGIEDLLPHMKCSLLQVKNNRVYNMAAPSIPKEYMDAIDKQPLSENAGSCGMAAYMKEKVIVADIASHAAWGNYRHLALKHNLRSCWSYPIINSDNEVIAVLGMYFDDVKPAGEAEKMVIERSAAILKVILENWHRSKIIEENAMLISQGQELANFGNWQWDIANNTVKWSDVLYSIYGVDKKNHVATFEGYLTLLHPDDRESVQNIIGKALQTKQDIVFEERIIRPNGEMRNLRSWGRVLLDGDGKPEKMIGSCLDITTAKKAESQLWDIAWMQSHLFRAPLVRLMGLVNLLKEEHESDCIDDQLFDYILSTAHELDKIVKDISQKTIKV